MFVAAEYTMSLGCLNCARGKIPSTRPLHSPATVDIASAIALTVMVNVVLPAGFAAVIVYTTEPVTADGKPVMNPVLGLMEIPSAKEGAVDDVVKYEMDDCEVENAGVTM